MAETTPDLIHEPLVLARDILVKMLTDIHTRVELGAPIEPHEATFAINAFKALNTHKHSATDGKKKEADLEEIDSLLLERVSRGRDGG